MKISTIFLNLCQKTSHIFEISQSYQGISAIFTKKIQEKRPKKSCVCNLLQSLFILLTRNKPATAKKVINKSVDNFLLTLPLMRAPISPPTASAVKNVP